MTRAVVIGGGPTGLSTAALLSRGGLEVTVVERNPLLGGRAAPLRSKGKLLDASPWPYDPEAVARFFALLGREESPVEHVEPAIRFRAFFDRGLGVQADSADLSVDIPSQWSLFESWQRGDGEGAHRLALHLNELGHDFRTRLGVLPLRGRHPVFQASVLGQLPLLRRALKGSVGRHITDAVQNPKTARLLEAPALALTGSPETTPPAFGEACILPLLGPPLCPRGGVGSIIRTMETAARDEGVGVELDWEAARILVDPETRLATGVVSTSGRVVAADLVVSCIEPFETETSLLTGEFRSFSPALFHRQTASPSAVVAAITVKKRVTQLAHFNVFLPRKWDGVLADPESSTVAPSSAPFAFVTRPTATESTAAPKGKDLLVLMVPLPADPSLGGSDESRDALTRFTWRLLSSVESMAGIPDLCHRSTLDVLATPADFASDFSAWKGSVLGPAPTVGQILRKRPGNQSRRIPNLLYPGASVIPAGGWAGSFESAMVTVKVLLGRDDAGYLSGPLEPGFLSESSRTDVLGDLMRQGS